MCKLVSLIMPVAIEDYLEEAVSSIFRQSYTNWELIIVGGRMEVVQQVTGKINDSRIKYTTAPETPGLLQAFSAGFSLSSGEFIIRHDADDISIGDRLMKQVTYLNRHPEQGMVSCLIHSFSSELDNIENSGNFDKYYNLHRTPDSIDNAILQGFVPVLFPTLMIRRSLLSCTDLCSSKTGFNDHMELFLSLLKSTETAKIEEVLYLYRRHGKAYHLVYEKDYIKHIKLLLDEDLKQGIRYRNFNNEVRALPAACKSSCTNMHINTISPLRVLFLVDTLGLGGTESHVLNLAVNLAKSGAHVVIVSSGGIFEPLFIKLGIKCYKILFGSLKGYDVCETSIPNELKEIIDMERINLIHCHLHASAYIAQKLFSLYRIPYIVTLHGMFYSGNELFETCTDAAAVIAVSEPVYSLFLQHMGDTYKGTTKIIYNSVDTRFFKPGQNHKPVRDSMNIGSDALLIVYCSRLGHNKGRMAEEFIQCFEFLCGKYPNLYGLILGDGDRKEIIRNKALECNRHLSRNALCIMGARYDVLSCYLESDLVVGTGRVTLEAMSCGKPTISLGSRGLIGIVSPESKEILLRTYFGDHAGPAEADCTLLQCMDSLLSSETLREQLGRFGRDLCLELFDYENLMKEIIEIYKHAAGSYRSGYI